jgi:hypothetical protein
VEDPGAPFESDKLELAIQQSWSEEPPVKEAFLEDCLHRPLTATGNDKIGEKRDVLNNGQCPEGFISNLV